jgi:hypothetical protein
MKASNFLIEKIYHLKFQLQTLIQNTRSKIELIKRLDELAAQNSIQGDELKRHLDEMLDRYLQSWNQLSLECYQGMLAQLKAMNDHLE